VRYQAALRPDSVYTIPICGKPVKIVQVEQQQCGVFYSRPYGIGRGISQGSFTKQVKHETIIALKRPSQCPLVLRFYPLSTQAAL